MKDQYAEDFCAGYLILHTLARHRSDNGLGTKYKEKCSSSKSFLFLAKAGLGIAQISPL